MKQRRFFNSPAINWVFMLSAVSLLTMSSCGLFNRGSSQSKTAQGKVPTSYNKAGTPPISTLEARKGYIERFKRIAISEMERTGVPASIKLAQGLLESDAGRSTLSSGYNNHFGIKCHSTWQGERFYKEDDDIDPLTGQLIKSCFRVYKNADESFIAHSEFLRDPAKVNRYGSLFQLQKNDYVGWAQGLQRAGYATAQDYGDKLVKLIQDYQLAQYDNLSLRDVATNVISGGNTSTRPNDDFPVSGFPSGTQSQPTTNTNPNTSWLPGWENARPQEPTNLPIDTDGERNNVKYARAFGQMTPYELAGKYGVSIASLQSYNEELPDPRTPLAEGAVIYLQKKRSYWRGAEKTYKVRDCETMYDISQKFGIKLSKLYSKNVMRQGEQPAVGQTVLLRRGWFEGADKPALRDTFGEWRRCKMDTSTGNNPNVVTYPPTTSTLPGNNSGLGFEVTPNNGQPSPNNNPTYYPPTTPSYPSTTPSYPSTTPSYPSTTPSYPSTTPSYPSTTPSYPSTTPSYPSTTPSKPPTTPTAPAGAQFHTVGVKETLWAISRKYGTTVDALKQLNGLTDNLIKPGQQLRVK